MIEIDRQAELSPKEFLRRYADTNRPVVVTGSLKSMNALQRWTPSFFRDRFGALPVPIQGRTFDSRYTTSVAEFVDKLDMYKVPFAHGVEIPYLKSTSTDENVFSVETYNTLKSDWHHPDFLPRRGYIFSHSTRKLWKVFSGWDPQEKKPSGFGVLISPCGAVSELHVDGLRTEAIVCQFYGEKMAYLFPPSATEALREWKRSGPRLKPGQPPQYGDAIPHVAHTKPGDTLYIPHSWFHEVFTLSTSISLSYNFTFGRHVIGLVAWKLKGGDNVVQDFRY